MQKIKKQPEANKKPAAYYGYRFAKNTSKQSLRTAFLHYRFKLPVTHISGTKGFIGYWTLIIEFLQ